MAIKAIVDQVGFDALPTEIQGHFIQQADKSWKLGVEKVGDIDLVDVKGGLSALSKERELLKGANAKLKTFETDFKDINPKAAREALEKVKEFADLDPEKKLAESKTLFEKQLTEKSTVERTKLIEKHNGEKLESDKQVQSLQSQLSNALVDQSVASAILDQGGFPHLLTHTVKNAIRVVDQDGDGKFAAIIVDKDGNPRLSTTPGVNGPMSILEYVSELREDENYKGGFSSDQKGGSGALPGQHQKPGGLFVLTREDCRNPKKYQEVTDAARKAGQTVTFKA